MRHDPRVWHLALKALKARQPATLFTVVESLGSSPGRAGFALCVTADDMAGSIGGGAMEHRFLGQARLDLQNPQPVFVQRQIHDPEADTDRSGMICSGEQTFVAYSLTQRDLPVVEAAVAALEKEPHGLLTLDASGLQFDPEGQAAARHLWQAGPDWRWQDDWSRRDQLHIVGGGHCALALSQLAATLEFEIVVYDDRPGLPTWEANTWAHRKVLVPSYTQMHEFLPEGDDVYVCVMTFGYKTDDLVLRSIMNQHFRFLGALGSRSKIDQMFAAYQGEGIAPEVLRRIHAPLGLPIHSQTPAEIAVSICAQLIRERNQPPRSSS